MFSDAVDGSKATITVVSVAACADVLAVGFASGGVHLFDRYVSVPCMPSIYCVCGVAFDDHFHRSVKLRWCVERSCL
jgi:hypothetical protein